MNAVAASHSLFEIDAELDALVEEIQEEIELKGEASADLTTRFEYFCQAHGEKVDRIGRFVRMMEAREQFCRTEAARLADRARAAANKVNQTKSMVLFFLLSRELRKVEGREFTLRVQKDSQDSVAIIDESAVPILYCKKDFRLDGGIWNRILCYLPEELGDAFSSSVLEKKPNVDAIKTATNRNEQVPGAEVRRGYHLRVA